MQLHSLRCRFGRLDGCYRFDRERLSLILEQNERGKTTLVEAVAAALYGYARGTVGLAERRRYLPLNGGLCFVELDLSVCGRALLIRRELDESAGERVRVWAVESGSDLTAELAPSKGKVSLGERLLGLSREQFLGVCLLRQGSSEGAAGGASLADRLAVLVDTTAGERTARAAIEALEQALRLHEGSTFKTRGQLATEIARLEQRLADARAEQERLRARRAAVDVDARRLAELDAEDCQDEAALQRVVFLADCAEAAELEASAREQSRREQRIAALQHRVAELAAERVMPMDSPVRLENAYAARRGAEREAREARAEQQEAQDSLSVERERLQRYGSLAQWSAADRDLLVAAVERLRAAVEYQAAADAGWPEGLGNVDREPQALDAWSASPYVDLSDAERRVLLAYRGDSAQLRLVAQRQREAVAALATSRRHRRGLLAAAVVAALTGLLLLPQLPLAGVAALVVAAVFLGCWWLLPLVRIDLQIVEARALAVRDLHETEARLAALEQGAVELAQRIGAVSADAAALGLEQFLAEQAAAGELRTRAELRRRAAADRLAAAAQLASLCQRGGASHLPQAVAPADGERLRELVDAALAQQRRTAEAERALQRAEQVTAEREERLLAAHASWERFCAQLYLPAEDVEGAMALARMGAARGQELEALERELELLLLLPRRFDNGCWQRLQALQERIAAWRAAAPAAQGLCAEHSAGVYIEQQRAIQQRRELRRHERELVRDRAGRELDEVRARLPEAIDAETEAQRRLAAALRYEAALRMAIGALSDVAVEAHRTWAEVLNGHAVEALQHLAPGYEQARFGPNLELSVCDRGGRLWTAREIHERLSAGARDRIYLAARIALAAACSPVDDPLPLLLDDPFASSDDERFREAMHYLLEQVAPGRQVILLSCHRSRYEALGAAEPTLWHERVCSVSLTRSERSSCPQP